MLADVCKVLDLTQPSKVAARLSEKQRGRNTIPTPSGDQEMLVVNESGLYKVIMQSRKPGAEKFTDWVADEVLPSVRKTGMYATPEAAEKLLDDLDDKAVSP